MEAGSSRACKVELLLLLSLVLSMPHSAWNTDSVFSSPRDFRKSATTLSLASPVSKVSEREKRSRSRSKGGMGVRDWYTQEYVFKRMSALNSSHSISMMLVV